MAGMDKNMKVQISIEMAQDAEEFIRKLIREEIEAYMAKQALRFRAQTGSHLPHETKATGEGWER